MGLFSKETKVETIPQEPIEDLPPHRVGNQSTILKPQLSNAEGIGASEQAVSEFVSEAPLATYYIDSSQDVKESLLCRQKPEGGQSCLKLAYDYTQLFKTMQELNFYCATPAHKVDAQYLECNKIK